MNKPNLLCITGSYPPDICGVGDYSQRLVDASLGSISIYHSSDWSLKSIRTHIKAINKFGLSYINMQYPSQGYGWSIVPHLLCIYYSWFTNKNFSVTLHECSQLSYKSRIALFFILLSANKLIFTNSFEREYAVRRSFNIRRRSTVIKIFSNIPRSEYISSIDERINRIVYFGQIRPNKGIERFIEDTISLVTTDNIYLVGQVPIGFESYYSFINEKCERARINVILNVTDKQIQKFLDDTRLLYLPFPDGVSERRGSVLAAFANGTPVMTTTGRFTTPELRRAIIDINDNRIEDVMNDSKLLLKIQQAATSFISTEMPKDWSEIVDSYITFLK